MICAWVAVSASIFLAAPVLAGGLYLYEMGTPDAGLAVRAQDANKTAIPDAYLPAGYVARSHRVVQVPEVPKPEKPEEPGENR
jgi:hypothetical protein